MQTICFLSGLCDHVLKRRVFRDGLKKDALEECKLVIAHVWARWRCPLTYHSSPTALPCCGPTMQDAWEVERARGPLAEPTSGYCLAAKKANC